MVIGRGDDGLTQTCSRIILVKPWDVLWCKIDPMLWDSPGYPGYLTWWITLSISKFTCCFEDWSPSLWPLKYLCVQCWMIPWRRANWYTGDEAGHVDCTVLDDSVKEGKSVHW
jgi:hypothetical protein